MDRAASLPLVPPAADATAEPDAHWPLPAADAAAPEPCAAAALVPLPDAVLHYALQMLDTGSLLRLSETGWRAHAAVTADLFRLDICVHCSTPFGPLDNRSERCLPIRNKAHRRHKGERAANARELRRTRELVEQRLRIARGHRFAVDDGIKETRARRVRRGDRRGAERAGPGAAGAIDAGSGTSATGSRTRTGARACPRPRAGTAPRLWIRRTRRL